MMVDPADSANASLPTPALRQPTTQKLRFPHFLILGLILAVAAFVRFDQIAQASLWMDEIWSIEISTGRGSAHDHLPTGVIRSEQADLTILRDAPAWWHIWARMAGITHPPLYHVVLRWWMDLFGASAAAARSLSTLFSLGAILILFDVGRLLHSIRVGLLAAAIMALAGAQIDFAQDARSYAMLIFVMLCAADALVRIEKSGVTRLRLFSLTISLFAAALTHYFSLGLLAALGCYCLLRLSGSARNKTILAFAAAGLCVAIVWLPFLPAQLHSLPSLKPGFLNDDPDGHFLRTLLRVNALPAAFLLGQDWADKAGDPAFIAITALTIILPLFLLRWRRDTLLWFFWLLATLGAVAALDLAHDSRLLKWVRYTILASPAIYALLASIEWPRRPILRPMIPLLMLVCLAVLAFRRLQSTIPPIEDWRQFAAAVNVTAGPDDLLIFYGDNPWISPGMKYMGYRYYTPDAHRPWMILQSSANASLLRQLQSRQAVWLIGDNPRQDGPIWLPGWYPQAWVVVPSVGAMCRMVPITPAPASPPPQP